jgi:hypothetical protein
MSTGTEWVIAWHARELGNAPSYVSATPAVSGMGSLVDARRFRRAEDAEDGLIDYLAQLDPHLTRMMGEVHYRPLPVDQAPPVAAELDWTTWPTLSERQRILWER